MIILINGTSFWNKIQLFMADSPRKTLQVFSKIGFAQILPSVISIGIVLFLTAVVLFFVISDVTNTPISNQRSNLSRKDLYEILGIFIPIIISLLGLFLFLFSSYFFTLAKRKNDIKYITRGMYSLNWAFSILTLFTIICVSITIFSISLYI